MLQLNLIIVPLGMSRELILWYQIDGQFKKRGGTHFSYSTVGTRDAIPPDVTWAAYTPVVVCR